MILEMDGNLVFHPSGEDEICPIFTVRQAVEDSPGISASKLYRLLASITGCSERTAMHSTARAVELDAIRREGKSKPVNFYPVGNCTNDFTNNPINTDENNNNSLPHKDLEVIKIGETGEFHQ